MGVHSNNPSLTNLNGLSSLKQIRGYKSTGGGLEIKNNTSLTNVDGLSALTAIEAVKSYLTVTDNSQLASCCGLYNVLNSSSLNCSYGCSYVTLSGNGAGCTRDEILAACVPPGQGCIGDIYLTSQKAIDGFPARSCTASTGMITITGNDITNLDSLYVLTSVGNLSSLIAGA